MSSVDSLAPQELEIAGLEEQRTEKDDDTEEREAVPGIANEQMDEISYPGPIKLTLVLLSLSLAVFLYGLDQTIIATAIPKITDEFHALGDVGWYAAAYLLTSSAFQLLWGKMFTIFSIKLTYLSAVAIFEIGSLVCATAPSSVAFIVGRAVAGVGAAGVYSGSVIVLMHVAPLEKRPMYIGILGAAMGVASICGPFLGGVFSDSVTWRWCFYINLPLGGLTLGIVALFVHIKPNEKYAVMGWWERLKRLDLPGLITLVPAIVCLLLALQWGGTTYPWSSARIIVLFVLFGLLAIGFVVVQRFTPRTRTIPSSIFRSRSIAFTTWYAGCTIALFVVMVYYLPIWFQGVQQVSAFESGVRTMPLILGFIVFALLSGILTSVIGFYNPFMIISSILTPIGIGLLTTLNPSSPRAHWISYQALFGLGVGTGIQQPLMVIQTVLPESDVPIGTALITLTQSLFGAVFVSVAQSVFQARLASNIATVLPGFDISTILTSSGATDITAALPPDAKNKGPALLDAYSKSITQTFYIAVALGVLSMIGALGIEWKTIKKHDKTKSQGKKNSETSEKTTV
ncbi:hypothetical protein MMC18_009597 [Xylographa bjoerkii]|nr:hypothetical protein [Xylographa bjoerkii]